MGKRVCLVSLMVLILIIPLNALGQSEQAKKVIEVRVTGHMPIGHQNTVANQRFMKEAEAKSQGRLKFTYYPAGQLAIDMKAIDMCRRGAIEMAEIFEGRAVGLVPEVNLAVPYFDHPDWFARRMYDPASGGGFFYKYYRPKFAKHGLHIT